MLFPRKVKSRIERPPELCRQIVQIYLGTDNIDSEHTGKILGRLNCLNSAEEVMKAIGKYSGQSIFGMVMAQRIFKAKTRIGQFRDLNQLATLPGIGPKKLSLLMAALGDCS
jgi:hypothetical protein